MKILILLGAGASVPSGIPSFQGKTSGKYNLKFFDINYLKKNKQEGILFFKDIKKQFQNVKPNEYHSFLDTIESMHDIDIISQNIDNLDIKYTNLIKIHGNIAKNKCLNNKNHIIKENQEIGERCKKCNSYIIPNILYYNEPYPEEIKKNIKEKTKKEYDYFIIIGTSLNIGYVKNIIVDKVKAKIKININPEIEIDNFINFKTYEDFIDNLGFVLSN